MKKTLLLLFVLLNISLLMGCSQKESTMSALSTGQQKAVKNSIEFIKNSSFTSKSRINNDIVNIKNADENIWKTTVSKTGDSRVKESSIDSTDWVITIGNTSDHDFAVIVCDSSTNEVIGYMPIK